MKRIDTRNIIPLFSIPSFTLLLTSHVIARFMWGSVPELFDNLSWFAFILLNGVPGLIFIIRNEAPTIGFSQVVTGKWAIISGISYSAVWYGGAIFMFISMFGK